MLYTIWSIKTRVIPWRSWLAVTLSPRDFALTTPAPSPLPAPPQSTKAPKKDSDIKAIGRSKKSKKSASGTTSKKATPKKAKASKTEGKKGSPLKSQ